jgi:hypothetical protein
LHPDLRFLLKRITKNDPDLVEVRDPATAATHQPLQPLRPLHLTARPPPRRRFSPVTPPCGYNIPTRRLPPPQIDLHNRGLTDADASELAHALRSNTMCQRLLLRGNKIGTPGCSDLCTTMKPAIQKTVEGVMEFHSG